VNFAGLNTGDEVLLENSAGAPFPNGALDVSDVMQFRVTSLAGDTDPLPTTLRSTTALDPASAVATRDFVLKRSGLDLCGRQSWKINGLGWHDISEFPELGSVEIWRFINDSGVAHPMHMHLVAFQVLDRDGFTTGPGGEIVPNGTPQVPPAEERGWKDTAMVAPNEILRVIAKFEDYTGKYPYHCHILEHEDNEMMRQFQTVQCGNALLEPGEECDDGDTAGADGCNAVCESEAFVYLRGTAAGGSVSVSVEGIVVNVTTVAGQTAAEVAAAIAAGINANADLQTSGVAALASGASIATDGTLGPLVSDDAGIILSTTPNPVPALRPWATALLAALLLVVAVRALRLRAIVR
jgi:cysteine-rich repeat protein